MSTSPATLSLSPGTEVMVFERIGVIIRPIDMNTVLVRDSKSGQAQNVNIKDIHPTSPKTIAAPKLETVSDDLLKLAQGRLDAIRPLLGLAKRTREQVTVRAQEIGIHPSTLYVWLGLYEPSGLLTALIPKIRDDKGVKRLSEGVETIIEVVLDEEYLRKQQKSPGNVHREIVRRCKAAQLDTPHLNTIRKRIEALPLEKRTARRQGRKAAENRFSISEGSFPGADWPLAFVQIDHTKLDIILVDDIHRRPIGRPWITLAIDVFSRMTLGFYISFDPPGAMSTGLCVSHAILPKAAGLAKNGIEGEWPCWGFPKTLHLDNAKEFRGAMLERACRQYGINVEWRPVARPHFGGHIERLLGTFSKEIHALPGTTFSNTKQRGEYDSESKAALTFSEFEIWLTTYIVQVYHLREHTTLGMSPVAKFREGIFGTATVPGVGLSPKIIDEERLRLDFMPFEERTVQEYGVVIDNVYYWHDVLRRWVGAADPVNSRQRRKFLFRIDPRDISVIWFFDPELQIYYAIPYRDTSHPAISIWELREARRRLDDEGGRIIDEAAIFAAYDRMREIEDEAKAKTKAARRATQRRSMGIGATAKTVTPSPVGQQEQLSMLTTLDIQPFDEMDDLQ